jgi:hypothetical protein
MRVFDASLITLDAQFREFSPTDNSPLTCRPNLWAFS